MNNSIKLVSLLIFGFLLSCNTDPNKRLNEGQIIDGKYINSRFGIEIEIPMEWRVATKLEANYYKNKGHKLSEKEFGSNTTDTWTELLQIQKGISSNQMIISSSKYKPELHGDSYAKSKESRFYGIKKIIESKAEIKSEAIRSETEIDGIQFDTYNNLIKKGDKIKAYQILLEKKYANDDILFISILATEREELEEVRTIIKAMKIGRKK